MFLSIVIALYNEEGNIVELTDRIYSAMDKARIPFELIYVIDGSDRTYELAQAEQSKRKNLILDHYPTPRGFRTAFVKGFSLANPAATHILTLDGDLNHRPEEIINLVQAMQEKKVDIVVGSRYIEGGKVERLALWKRGISVVANVIIKWVWKLDLKDKTSGYRLYKKEVIDSLVPRAFSPGFEFLFELLILARKQNYAVVEIPILFITREHGESKFRLGKTMKGYAKLLYWDLVKRRY